MPGYREVLDRRYASSSSNLRRADRPIGAALPRRCCAISTATRMAAAEPVSQTGWARSGQSRPEDRSVTQHHAHARSTSDLPSSGRAGGTLPVVGMAGRCGKSEHHRPDRNDEQQNGSHAETRIVDHRGPPSNATSLAVRVC
jgi:hypothetical protein